MLRLQAGDQLGLQTARLLGVEITDLLGDIKERGDGLVMALLRALLSGAASAADLNRELLTLGVTDKLAGLLLDVLGGTGGLIDCSADSLALAIAVLDQRPVALLDILLDGLLLEGDLAGLLEVLLTDLLLSRGELGDVGVVALLHILVGALQDGVLLQGGDSLLSLDTAEASVGIILAAAEVHAGALDAGLPASTVPLDDVGSVIGGGDREKANKSDECLKQNLSLVIQESRAASSSICT